MLRAPKDIDLHLFLIRLCSNIPLNAAVEDQTHYVALHLRQRQLHKVNFLSFQACRSTASSAIKSSIKMCAPGRTNEFIPITVGNECFVDIKCCIISKAFFNRVLGGMYVT